MGLRLITRGDLDGLACAVVFGAHEQVDEIILAHPQDVVQGRIRATPQDVVANLPYLPESGRWFDHRPVTAADPVPPRGVPGKHEPNAPSAAGLVWRAYGRDQRFRDLVQAADQLDGGRLSAAEIDDPRGHLLLGFTLDGRSGLGSFQYYFLRCVDWLREMDLAEVLRQPLVENRVERLRREREECLEALRTHSRQEGNVVVTDLRSRLFPPVGNRFLIYRLFPEADVSVRLQWGPQREFVAATVGRSVLRRTCRADLAELMARYGGGGHARAAGAPLPRDEADRVVGEIVKELRSD